MNLPFDHYIYKAHMQRWAANNRVTMLRRGMGAARVVDLGRKVAAEQGLNDSRVEAGYGKVESAFARALPKMLDSSVKPDPRHWEAVREYIVLVHDRYPALRGSSTSEFGLRGGNAAMPPNPEHWGAVEDVMGGIADLAVTMDRESLKGWRLGLLPFLARALPPAAQVIHCGPLILGDAGVHAMTLNLDRETAQSFVVMPLTPSAFVSLGSRLPSEGEARALRSALILKTAMESTVVIDTLDAPLINGIVGQMWSSMEAPAGSGRPRALRLWDRVEDIPDGTQD